MKDIVLYLYNIELYYILAIFLTWILRNRRFLNVTERPINLLSYVTLINYRWDCNISMLKSHVRFLFVRRFI